MMPRSVGLLTGLVALVLAVLVSARAASAHDTGFIRVQCDPDIQVFLDGTLQGISNRGRGGLVLEAVPVGERTVKVLKAGFTPQERRVRVAKGAVAVVTFEALRAGLKVEQGGDEQAAPLVFETGTLIVKSVPVECKVLIERAGGGGGFDAVGEIDKVKPEATVSKLEIGRYRITATWNEVALTKTCDLAADDQVTIFFNFVAKGVEMTSVNERLIDLGGEVTMDMVPIEPGRFRMGSPAVAGVADERPQREVIVTKGFWLGQTEVTQAQWQAVMGNNPSHFRGDPSRPVERVSWNDAVEFCTRLSKRTGMEFRLPTEAEWEYACRAGTTTDYSFGSDAKELAEYAWFSVNSGGSTKPVGTRKPNPWGLHDMHGNVGEWVSDGYGPDSERAQTDPRGPSSGLVRVLRGGSWYALSDYCRSSHRVDLMLGSVDLNNGFRVARTR